MSRPHACPDCRAQVVSLIAAEFDRHRACLEQRFARDLAQALKALEPPASEPDAQAFRRGAAAATRVVLHCAGLTADTPAEVKP